jgi:hypothetical protein
MSFHTCFSQLGSSVQGDNTIQIKCNNEEAAEVDMFNHKDQSFIEDRSSAGDVIILIPQTIERDMMPSKPVPDQQSKKGDQGYPVDDVIAITPQSNEFYFAHNEWVQKELDQIDEMMSNQHSKNWGQRYPAADGNSQNKWVQNTAVHIELV